mgnify:CR=1 FL=1
MRIGLFGAGFRAIAPLIEVVANFFNKLPEPMREVLGVMLILNRQKIFSALTDAGPSVLFYLKQVGSAIADLGRNAVNGLITKLETYAATAQTAGAAGAAAFTATKPIQQPRRQNARREHAHEKRPTRHRQLQTARDPVPARAPIPLPRPEPHQQPGGDQAVQLKVAEKAVDAYAQLAQKNNTMIVPGNMSEVGGLIGTAMALMKGVKVS